MMKTILRLAVVLMFVVALGLLAVAQGNGQGDRRGAVGAQDRPIRGPQTGASSLSTTPPPDQQVAGVTRALAVEGRTLREWDDGLVARERVRELRLRSRQADTLIPAASTSASTGTTAACPSSGARRFAKPTAGSRCR